MAATTVAPEQKAPTVAPQSISISRRMRNRLWWGLCGLMLAILVGVVVWILGGAVAKAVLGWHWNVLWTKSTGTGGGLSTAIVGTFFLMFCIGIVAAIIGIGAGIYLAEIAGNSRHATVLRSAAEILSGIPSIVFGYCVYLTLVTGLRWGEGLVPAVIAVSLIVVPYIAKSTELALNQVPLSYREGGEALGMTKTLVLRRVVMRSAIPGILTGLIVALAISVGETAPLLYTAGFSNAYPTGALVHSPVGYLTGAIYTLYNSPSQGAQALAKDGAVLLVALVLLLILATRLIVALTQKFSPNRSASTGGRRGRREATEVRAAAAARVDAARDLAKGN